MRKGNFMVFSWQYALVCAVVGCFSLCGVGCGSAPVNSYYTLENTMPKNDDVPNASLCKAVLAIDSVTVDPPFDLTKIAFRPDELEVRYYTHRHWVCSPEEMMRKLLIRRLATENLFDEVDSIVFLPEPDLTLFVKVQNLEEIDRNKTWNGRLAMSFSLKDDVSDDVVWEYRFDEINPAKKNDIKEMIQAINDIYNRQMVKVVHALKLFITRYKKCSGHGATSED